MLRDLCFSRYIYQVTKTCRNSARRSTLRSEHLVFPKTGTHPDGMCRGRSAGLHERLLGMIDFLWVGTSLGKWMNTAKMYVLHCFAIMELMDGERFGMPQDHHNQDDITFPTESAQMVGKGFQYSSMACWNKQPI